MATLDAGDPCWMGVDVFKSYHTDLGILDTGMYDYDLVYGVSPGEWRRTQTQDVYRCLCLCSPFTVACSQLRVDAISLFSSKGNFDLT